MWPLAGIYRSLLALQAAVAALQTATDANSRRLDALTITFNKLGAHLVDEITKLKASVAANTTVIGSAKTLLDGLKVALDKAIAALPDVTALSELSATIDANDADLAASVAKNTPAAP